MKMMMKKWIFRKRKTHYWCHRYNSALIVACFSFSLFHHQLFFRYLLLLLWLSSSCVCCLFHLVLTHLHMSLTSYSSFPSTLSFHTTVFVPHTLPPFSLSNYVRCVYIVHWVCMYVSFFFAVLYPFHAHLALAACTGLLSLFLVYRTKIFDSNFFVLFCE